MSLDLITSEKDEEMTTDEMKLTTKKKKRKKTNHLKRKLRLRSSPQIYELIRRFRRTI